MVATIASGAWLEIVKKEYLESFIKDGGSAIKFVVPMEGEIRASLEDQLINAAKQMEYIAMRVSSAETRIHMIDQLFFRIAEQVPWRLLSERVNLRLASEAGFLPPEEEGADSFIARLASANSMMPGLLKNQLQVSISEKVWPQRSLAKEFRIAVTHLCIAEMSEGH